MVYAQSIKEKVEMLPASYQVRLCAVLDDMAKETKQEKQAQITQFAGTMPDLQIDLDALRCRG